MNKELQDLINQVNVKLGLVEPEPEVELLNSVDVCCFLEAIDRNDIDKVRDFISDGFNVNCKNGAPLGIACTRGDMDMVSLLRSEGALDCIDALALKIAVDRKYDGIAELLLRSIDYSRNVLYWVKDKAGNNGSYGVEEMADRILKGYGVI